MFTSRAKVKRARKSNKRPTLSQADLFLIREMIRKEVVSSLDAEDLVLREAFAGMALSSGDRVNKVIAIASARAFRSIAFAN